MFKIPIFRLHRSLHAPIKRHTLHSLGKKRGPMNTSTLSIRYKLKGLFGFLHFFFFIHARRANILKFSTHTNILRIEWRQGHYRINADVALLVTCKHRVVNRYRDIHFPFSSHRFTKRFCCRSVSNTLLSTLI